MLLITGLCLFIFTRGQFWPSGIVVACVCPCVRQSPACLRNNSSQVRFRITKFGPKMLNILFKVPIVLGTDGAWPSWSNLALFKNSVYLHRFCIFEIFVRRVCWTVPHPTWLCTRIVIPTCTATGSCHGPWSSLLYILVRPLEFQSASTRRLALDFTSCCRFSTYCTHLTCRNFIWQHSAIVETTVKQRQLTCILFQFQQGYPRFHLLRRYF